MTKEQMTALQHHVAWHRSIPHGGEDGEVYFLEEGMIVEFTNCQSYSANSKFQINNDRMRFIWFSQLSNIFIEQDLSCIAALIKDKNNNMKQIRAFSDREFWNEVKGKKYRVEADGPFYIINNKSKTADEKGLFTHQAVYDYVKSCVENNMISDVGDCLKNAKSYCLIEI